MDPARPPVSGSLLGGAPQPVAKAAPGVRLTEARQPSVSLGAKVRGFVALTKPRIIELLLVETVPVMILAKRGWPGLWLVIVTVVGGTLSAGGANAVNMWFDRDIDSEMERTQSRPLVTGVVQPTEALVFALVVEAIAIAMLAVWVNPLSAALSFAAFLFYVFVYTIWLKRRYASNIVIGGAAGAVPVLIGWSAVTNTLSWSAWVLFALVFFWTPPHFWALAIKYRDDYSKVSVPMLPSVASDHKTTVRIIAYSAIVVACSLLLTPVGDMSWVYSAVALISGGVMMWLSIRVHQEPSQKRAMALFGYSITYLSVLFAAIALDPFIGSR